MINNLSTNIEDYKHLIGLQVRKPDFFVIGTVATIAIEHDAFWKNAKVWLVLDTGERVLANKIGSYKDEIKLSTY